MVPNIQLTIRVYHAQFKYKFKHYLWKADSLHYKVPYSKRESITHDIYSGEDRVRGDEAPINHLQFYVHLSLVLVILQLL